MIAATLDITALPTDRLIQDAVAAAIARLAGSAAAATGPDAAPPPIIAAIQIVG